MTKEEACKNHYYAYEYAVIHGPCTETRTAACKEPFYAYMYAKHIDKGPCDETRTAACKDSWYAYLYASDIDKRSCNETWQVVQGSDYEQAYIGRVGMSNSTGEIKQEEIKQESHEGMIQNPLTGEWSWF